LGGIESVRRRAAANGGVRKRTVYTSLDAVHLVVADVAVVFFEKNIEKGQVEAGSFGY